MEVRRKGSISRAVGVSIECIKFALWTDQIGFEIYIFPRINEYEMASTSDVLPN